MCERNNRRISSIPARNGCKCQANFYTNQQIQQYQPLPHQSHHKINENKANDNMIQQQEHQSYHQLNNMPVYYPTNVSPSASTNSISSQSSADTSDSASTSNSSLSTNNSTKSTPPLGVNLRVTGQCSQGGRKYMEDYFSVAYQQSDNAKDLEYAFIGIYDGHGGAEAAAFAKQHLMMEIINQKLFWSDSDQDVLRAIREGYVATHYAMWREQEKWPRTANGLPSTAGTTATIAFIRREKIYIGHVGDSAIVLGYQNDNEDFWRAKQITTDHKPESLAERTRINRSGGKVIVKSGVPRVVWNRPRNAMHKGPIRRNTPVDEIPFLAVARSLGDLWSYNSARNEFIVSPDPDVSVVRIDPKTFRCLIFGTDGLWNVVSASEAVQTVYEKEKINRKIKTQMHSADDVQWTNPSKSLVEKALKTWSAKKMRADNTSVVTVLLYPANGTEVLDHSSLPSSYGTVYTELKAEIPMHDDPATFHQISEKYLPPEEYRNFNYYDDDDDIDMKSIEKEFENDALVFKYNRPELMGWRNGYDKIGDAKPYIDNNNSWQWYVEDNKAYNNIVSSDDGIISTYDDNDDTNGEDMIETEISVTDYPQYIANTSNSARNNVAADPHATNGYMNSFAESYNSLLTDHITADANAANANSSYRSVSSKNMNDILHEQQLYQEQCMSEEDGYCLTKLETRGEQQRSADVQALKLCQQRNSIAAPTNYIQHPPSSPTNNTNGNSDYWDMRYQPISGNVNRYSMYPQSQQQQKILELNSVLQQEREEEQQVALERMQLERKMDNSSLSSNSNSYNCLQPISQEDNADEALFEEYLEDDHDDSVQINEITSSMEPTDEEINYTTEENNLIETTPQVTTFNVNVNRRSPIFEKLEKIEILCKKPDVLFEKTSKHVLNKKSLQIAPNSLPGIQTRYKNIPKENQNLSITASTNPLCKTKRYVQASTAESITVTPERRQLRSSGSSDYCKRTLRTRNSLTKDMKSKPTLVSTLKRNSSTTSQYLRAAAANMQENAKNQSENQQQRHAKPTTSRSLLKRTGSDENINNNSSSGKRNLIKRCSTNENIHNNANSAKRAKMDSNKCNLLSAAAVNAAMSHVINLRSRVINQIVGNAVITPPATYASTPNTRFGQRNLRSLSKTSNRDNRDNSCTPNYSKCTRLQSTISTLGAPPPSPKLINATAVVLAATRARSLLAAKNATVATVFSKRPSLRSSAGNNTCLDGVNSTYLLTRSRAARKLKR